MTTRSYKLIRDYRTVTGTVPGGKTVASYATLPAAVAGARRAYGRHPDSSLEIMAHGRVVRCLYHHGLPTDSRWSA